MKLIFSRPFRGRPYGQLEIFLVKNMAEHCSPYRNCTKVLEPYYDFKLFYKKKLWTSDKRIPHNSSTLIWFSLR